MYFQARYKNGALISYWSGYILTVQLQQYILDFNFSGTSTADVMAVHVARTIQTYNGWSLLSAITICTLTVIV